jgi:branched-chain amino acid transport system permease protein
VKGVYFAILTLLTGQIFRLVAYSWSGLTGGQLGLTGIPPIDEFSLPFLGTVGFDSTLDYYYLYAVILVIGLGVLYLLERSELGRRWSAIEGNDVLSESVGMNVLFSKILVFSLGCFFAGIAGSMYAHYWHVLGADSGSTFGLINGMFIVLYMFVGGKRKFYGPIVGTVVVLVLAEFCRPLREYQPMITAALGLAVVFLMPDGLVSLPGRFLHWYKTAKKARRSIVYWLGRGVE